MSKIVTSRCDSCGAGRVPVNINHRPSAPSGVLALCRICDPVGFEAQAREDIEAWLRGDEGAESRLGL